MQVRRFAARFPESGPISCEDCAEGFERTRAGRCNLREFDGHLSEVAKGPFHTVAVFDDLGHPIATTRIDGGD
jgi:hypothetical protein